MNFVAFLVYDRQILDTNMGESLLEHSTAQEILNGDRHGWSFWDHEAFLDCVHETKLRKHRKISVKELIVDSFRY